MPWFLAMDDILLLGIFGGFLIVIMIIAKLAMNNIERSKTKEEKQQEELDRQCGRL